MLAVLVAMIAFLIKPAVDVAESAAASCPSAPS